MPRVNVDHQALSDVRFYNLGILLGSPQEFAHSVGLATMIRVWDVCVTQEAYCLDGWVLNEIAKDENAAEKIVKAKLASGTKHHNLYRIRGTKGRTDYIKMKRKIARENGKKGGRPKKPTSVSERTNVGFQKESPLALVLDPVLALAQEDSEKTLIPPAEPVKRVRKPKQAKPYPDWFEEFWGPIAHKAEKFDAHKILAGLRSSAPPLDQIRDSYNAYVSARLAKDRDATPQSFCRWAAKRRWEDQTGAKAKAGPTAEQIKEAQRAHYEDLKRKGIV